MNLSRHIVLTALFLAIALPGWAQRTMSGKVSETSGEGIPGAVVMVSGTTKGAVSNMDGDWTLEVKGGEISLEVSCLGYTGTSIKVPAGQTRVDVVLEEDNMMLEDVLLTMGMARTLTMEPNIRYQHHFEMIEKEARESGSGFWGTGFFVK